MHAKWIYKFDKILQTHKDISDYEQFYTFYQQYILDNPNELKEIIKILYKCLKVFKKPVLLSIVYRLLSIVKTKIKLNRNLFKKHFRNKEVRNSMFNLLSKNSKLIKKRIIKKLLYDPYYEDQNFLQFIVFYSEMVNEFLICKDDKLLRKQLLVILYTKNYKFIDLFVEHLGNNNTHIGFIMYEILCEMSQTQFKSDFLKKVQQDCVIFEIKKKLRVRNINNFLIYFLCFMKEKSKIYKLILENKNLQIIENILKDKYIETDSVLDKIRNFNLYSVNIPDIKKEFSMLFDGGITNFDFLFHGTNYKTVSDCIEL